MARIRRKGSNTIEVDFDSNTRDQAGVVHLFDALLGRKPARTCEICGGIVPEDQEGRGVQKNARCTCATETPDGPSAA
jgi:hypothetical protein